MKRPTRNEIYKRLRRLDPRHLPAWLVLAVGVVGVVACAVAVAMESGAIGYPSVLIVLLCVWWYANRIDRHRRIDLALVSLSNKRCPDCGYDLTGAFGPRCPECGVDFDRYYRIDAARYRGRATHPARRAPPSRFFEHLSELPNPRPRNRLAAAVLWAALAGLIGVAILLHGLDLRVPGLLIAFAAVILALLTLWLINTIHWIRACVAWVRHREGCCPACGYSMDQSPTETCPECGTTMSEQRARIERLLDTRLPPMDADQPPPLPSERPGLP